MAIGRLNIGLTGVQPGGLAKVIPASVAVGSGSGSVDSNGAVTFSGVSSIRFNSVFSSSYQNYFAVYQIAQSTGAALKFRLASGSSVVDTSTYRRAGWYQEGASSSGTYYSIASGTAIILNDKINAAITTDIFRPFEAAATAVNYNLVMENGSVVGTVIGAGYNTNATSYDGFELSPDSGTMTGTVRVYGYN